MSIKHIRFHLLLVLGLGSWLQAATVVWVSDTRVAGREQGWIDLLQANGYTVDLSFQNQEGRSLDAAEIATLEAADLIIAARDMLSAEYSNQTSVWNGLATPVLTINGWLPASNRWKWVSVTTNAQRAISNLQAMVPDHPVFNDVALDEKDQIGILTADSQFPSTSDPGNGTLIARNVSNNDVWIVEWQKGQEFYPGAGQTAGGPRMLLVAGSQPDPGRYNLTAEGEKVFLNAVEYLLGNLKAEVKARRPDPADGAIGVTNPLLQWTKSGPVFFYNVYLGTSPDLTEAQRVATLQPFTMYFHAQPLVPGTTYYWRVDEIEADQTTTHPGDVWSFAVTPLTAWQPDPADHGAGVFPAPTLRWSPGQQAVKHRLYLSTNPAEVENAAPAAEQGPVTTPSFTAPLLRSSTTYYWRVDEVTPDGATQPGPVWDFTTADGAANSIVRQWWTGISGTAVNLLTGNARYPNSPTGSELLDRFEGPVDWMDNYGSRLYGWLIPPESAEYTFWIASDDYSELRLSTDADPANARPIANVPGYTTSQQWDKYPAQKSAPIALQGGQKYFLEAIMKEGTGGDNLAVSWQGGKITAQAVISAAYVDSFALPALQSFSPTPANGAVDTVQTQILSWSAGEKAQTHDVYFGADQAAVAAADTASPLYQGRQAGTTFNAGDLEWGKTYYWRVDEINASETDSPWKGAVWSFATADFIPLDDFESYNDDLEAKTTVFDTWIDGFTNGLSGSMVGNLQAPFAERTIVHGGKQSMPMDYNNVKSPFYSEAEREFSPVQNWTGNGVEALSLFWRGNAGNGAGQLYVAVEDNSGKVATLTNPAALTTTAWTEWKIPLSSFTGVNLSRIRVLYIGVGDKKAPAAGGAGHIYIDDIRVVKP